MILRFIALVIFIVAAVICLVDDTPDAFDILALTNAGLAAWVGAILAGDRLR